MTDFISIKEAKDNLKGNICATVVNISALKSGTTDNGDWVMKLITFDDGSDRVDIAAFSETEWSKFQLGAKYEIVNVWWKLKDSKLSVNFGNYYNIKKVSEPTEQTTVDKPVEKPSTDKSKEQAPTGLVEFVDEQNKILNAITKMVHADIAKQTKENEQVRGDIVWVRTKEIYNLWSQKNES